MKNDLKIKKLAENQFVNLKNWLDIVHSANQDAYTDRILEDIIKDGDKIKNLYYGIDTGKKNLIVGAFAWLDGQSAKAEDYLALATSMGLTSEEIEQCGYGWIFEKE